MIGALARYAHGMAATVQDLLETATKAAQNRAAALSAARETAARIAAARTPPPAVPQASGDLAASPSAGAQ